MSELNLVWHSYVSQEYILIGRLCKKEKGYSFEYNIDGAFRAQREGCHLPFRIDRYVQESESLFPFFKNRLMNPQRESYRNYLKSLGLNENDEFKILKLTQGRKITDNFLVVTEDEYRLLSHKGNSKAKGK